MTQRFGSVAEALRAFSPWPWSYFSAAEIACKGTGRIVVVPAFMDRMQRLREEYGRPVVVNSWYRTPEHNASVSSTGTSGPHTTGRAVDVRVYGRHAHSLVTIALERGFTGIGVKQTGEHKSRFVHIDDLDADAFAGPRPWVWSYV